MFITRFKEVRIPASQVFLALLSFMASGCSSLLYQPTTNTHYYPEALDLAPEEVWISGEPPGQPAREPLHGWYFHSPSPQGLVVFFHGNAENITSHFQTLAFLPKNNYDYFIFDYRGFGKSKFAESRSPSPQTTLEDGIAVLKWSEARAMKSKLPWVAFGQSLGGNILLRALQDSRIEPRAAILDSTFLSYPDVAQSILARTVLLWPFQWLGPLTLSDHYAPKQESLSRLPGSYPILILHGDQDPVVPFEQGMQVYRAVREPKVFWRILNGRHTDALWAHEWRYRDRFLALLDQSCLKTMKPRVPTELPPGIRLDRTWVYRLPIEDHKKTRVIQAENETFSHQGVHQYAIDFDLPVGTPIVAMRAGQVIQVESRYDRGGPSDRYQAFANLIRIQHSDGGVAEYVHLLKDSALVKKGDRVEEGQVIGQSGESGFASQPHLHVSVYLPEPDFPGIPQHSVPLQFDTEEEPAYRLKTGDEVTAINTHTYPRDFKFLLKR